MCFNFKQIYCIMVVIENAKYVNKSKLNEREMYGEISGPSLQIIYLNTQAGSNVSCLVPHISS